MILNSILLRQIDYLHVQNSDYLLFCRRCWPGFNVKPPLRWLTYIDVAHSDSHNCIERPSRLLCMTTRRRTVNQIILFRVYDKHMPLVTVYYCFYLFEKSSQNLPHAADIGWRDLLILVSEEMAKFCALRKEIFLSSDLQRNSF